MPLPFVELVGIIESDIEPGKYFFTRVSGNFPQDEEGEPVLPDNIITDPAQIAELTGQKGPFDNAFIDTKASGGLGELFAQQVAELGK